MINLVDLLGGKSDLEVVKKAKQMITHSMPNNLTDWEKEAADRHKNCISKLCGRVYTKEFEDKAQKDDWALAVAKAWLGHLISWCEGETNENGQFDFEMYQLIIEAMGKNPEEELARYKTFYKEYNMMAFNFKQKLKEVSIKKSPLGLVQSIEGENDDNRIQ